MCACVCVNEGVRAGVQAGVYVCLRTEILLISSEIEHEL